MGKKGKLRKQQQNQNINNTPPPAAQGGDEVLGRLSDAPMMGQSNPAPSSPTPSSVPTSGSGDPLSDILGGMMGNAGGQGGMPAGGDLSSILGGLLGGMGDAQGGMPSGGMPSGNTSQSSSSGDPMSDLLGSILGGGGASNTGAQGGDPLGGLLGGLFGGGGQMGASGGMGGLNSILAPLADAVSQKTGIPRDVAMSVMAVIIPMVMNKIMSSGQGNQGEALASLSSGSIPSEGLHFSSAEKQEMAQQLTAQTGMDHSDATNTLNQAIQVLGN